MIEDRRRMGAMGTAQAIAAIREAAQSIGERAIVLLEEARTGSRTAEALRSFAQGLERFNAGPCGAHTVHLGRVAQCNRPAGHAGAHQVEIDGVTFELVDTSTPQYPNEMVLGAVVPEQVPLASLPNHDPGHYI